MEQQAVFADRSRETAPASLTELYSRSAAAAAAIFGATSHRVDVVDDGDLEMDFARAESDFSLLSHGRLRIHRSVAEQLERFVRGDYSTMEPGRVDAEMAALAGVKAAVLTLFKEEIRALGPADPGLMRAEWDAYWKLPYVQGFSEGVREVAAQLFLDRFVRELQLDRRDCRLLNVNPPDVDRCFRRYSEAARAAIGEVADITGADFDEEVRSLVRDGQGELAMRRMCLRRVQSEPALSGGQSSMELFVRVREANEKVQGLFSGVQKEWAHADPGYALSGERYRPPVARPEGALAPVLRRVSVRFSDRNLSGKAVPLLRPLSQARAASLDPFGGIQ